VDYNQLNHRERKIAELIVMGASNKEIANLLDLSPQTVKNILVRVFARTGVRSRTQLAAQVIYAKAQQQNSQKPLHYQ
jgi:DNA-binding CsgD family transcriptional regulator